tara:strand:- start:7100 stop:7204 length:105 start_codon:yes stop_codon:yes gene_type:complete
METKAEETTEQLRDLEASGWVNRIVYAEVLPQIE